MKRSTSAVTAVLFAVALAPAATRAENQMGYSLETSEMAASLRRSSGSLGMDVGPEKDIASGGMTFELLKVESVAADSPAAQAGLKVGDQIIAVDGKVFANTATFAAYVGSVAPGRQIEIDYMPAGDGPAKAQRLGVTVGEGGHAVTSHSETRHGLSTGAKTAIGLGAVAVIGCYEAGCFHKLKADLDAERERLRARQGQTAPN